MSHGANDRPIVVVANRLPVSRAGQGWRISAGGLVTALRPVMEGRPGAWVGWDGGGGEVPNRVEGLDIELHPIRLGRAEINAYYHGFSNRSIWPLFHDLVEAPTFDSDWWEAYVAVNRRFAGTAAEQASGGYKAPGGSEGLLWVQDYHLMLVPRMLRDAGAHGRIAFFLHTPWPPPELFARLPWRTHVLRGLLGADVVSFHTDRYRQNFVRTCAQLLEHVSVRGNSIVLADGRAVATHANPISIDVGAFTELARSPQVQAEHRRLCRQFEGRRVLVGVDRLDYTKGILERLEAFELLLERRPDLRTRLAFVQIAVPSRGAVREYRELREAIEQRIGHINGRFTEPGMDVPVHYLHRGVSRERLVAYYRLADVFVVTALKDGMNLVSKEFVVSQAAGGGNGALVLSEFTGAALELTEAVPCNPFDRGGTADALEAALGLAEDERRRRLQAMARKIRRNDVFRWLEREIKAAEAVTAR